MDSREGHYFKGYRYQHNDAIEPFKCGLKFHPLVTADEIKALSIWMTFKCSIANLSCGGGKGGIIVNTSALSKKRIRKIIKRIYKSDL